MEFFVVSFLIAYLITSKKFERFYSYFVCQHGQFKNIFP